MPGDGNALLKDCAQIPGRAAAAARLLNGRTAQGPHAKRLCHSAALPGAHSTRRKPESGETRLLDGRAAHDRHAQRLRYGPALEQRGGDLCQKRLGLVALDAVHLHAPPARHARAHQRVQQRPARHAHSCFRRASAPYTLVLLFANQMLLPPASSLPWRPSSPARAAAECAH